MKTDLITITDIDAKKHLVKRSDWEDLSIDTLMIYNQKGQRLCDFGITMRPGKVSVNRQDVWKVDGRVVLEYNK